MTRKSYVEHPFSHTIQLPSQDKPTEADLSMLVNSPLPNRILEDISTPDASIAKRIENLNTSIAWSRYALGALIDDRAKRRAGHDAAAKQLDTLPPVSGDGQRNISSSSVPRITRDFFNRIAPLQLPTDIGLEIGHREHFGRITSEDEASIASLREAAVDALDLRAAAGTVQVRDVSGDLEPRARTANSTKENRLAIHRKTPLYDVIPHSDAMPHVRQIDVYERQTYAALSRPQQAMAERAFLEDYLRSERPTSIVNIENTWVLPISTSIIMRAHFDTAN